MSIYILLYKYTISLRSWKGKGINVNPSCTDVLELQVLLGGGKQERDVLQERKGSISNYLNLFQSIYIYLNL